MVWSGKMAGGKFIIGERTGEAIDKAFSAKSGELTPAPPAPLRFAGQVCAASAGMAKRLP